MPSEHRSVLLPSWVSTRIGVRGEAALLTPGYCHSLSFCFSGLEGKTPQSVIVPVVLDINR